jgi:hypothetical protein
MINTNAATSTELLQELREVGPVFVLAHVGANSVAYVRAHKRSLADAVRGHSWHARYSVTREAGGLFITMPGEQR